MRRTNIYLLDEQLRLLKRLAATRGESMAGLVRRAVQVWLDEQGVRAIDEDEWARRFGDLLRRRQEVASGLGVNGEDVDRDVADAVDEIRRESTAGRR